ncbi:S8 family serine peptidase [bacterium]|nr:S8 family serine peptidase [candidate division CSSED10-310 bacterium]
MRPIQIAEVISIALFCLVWGIQAPAGSENVPDLIEPELIDILTQTGTSDFVIHFTNQADLTPAYSMNWKDRGDFVYRSLRDTAQREQAAVRAYLDRRNISYSSFIAGNEIYVRNGSLGNAFTLAEYSEIHHIRSPQVIELPEKQAAGLDDPIGTRAQGWGIADIGADQFWSQMGFRGEGIVVAEMGTGVDWDHPALVDAYRCGSDPSDPACWEDPSNICGGSICDNNGFSTTMMGVLVGSDDPGLENQVGVAPGAQWITCKGCESSSCSEYALNTCADWMLAPDGDPSNRPHVVCCGWGGGGGSDWYLVKVQAWRAAGIFPVFGSGNTGPTCGEVGSPGDYQESFQCAGHDNTREIYQLSGRGPSDFGHDPHTKPNISAPCVNILTTMAGGGWTSGYVGSQLAAAHTTGAVALLWSYDPSLIGLIEDTFDILEGTADVPPAGNCGAPPDGEGNYTYGYGYLNILAAGMSRDTWTAGLDCPFEFNRFDGEFVPGPEGQSWANKVYFLGGRTGGSTASADIWIFDPVTQNYSDTGADMDTAVGNHIVNLIMDDGTGRGPALYVIGGYDVTIAANIADVQRYYPQTNQVEVVTTDPFPGTLSGIVSGAQGVAVVNDVIYVFGGWQSVTPAFDDRTWSFDPNAAAGSRWTVLSAVMSDARAYIMTAVVGGKIYAMGGDIEYTGSDIVPTDLVEVLNTTNPTSWTVLASMPIAQSEGQGFSAIANGLPDYWRTHVVVAGGGDWPDQTAECMSYDIAADSWDQGFANLITARRNHAGAFVPLCTSDPEDGLPGLWVFGGRTTGDDPPYGDPEFYPIECDMSPTPTPVPPTNTPVPPTNTPIPPTSTAVPPTNTPLPPTPTVPTGVPTNTQVPPTDTPIPPTDTPVEPTSTPECTVLGCEVYMPKDDFTGGDECFCDVYICNPNTETYYGVPVFVILDVYGLYFFAPSFGEFDYYLKDVTPGEMTINVLPSFIWPGGVGSASGILWYAAMTDPGITQLFGELGMFSFGWHA